jgi:hypothetical protein
MNNLAAPDAHRTVVISAGVGAYAVPFCPVLSGRIDAAMPQQKSQKLLPGTHQLHHGINARARQITHSLMRFIRNPDAD